MDIVKIQDALKKFDPTNDNHWTMDGLAKLDTLKMFAGGSVTREELEVAAPGFSRSALTEYLKNAPAEASNVESAQGSGDGSAESVVAEPDTTDVGPANREAEKQALAEEIARADEAVLEFQRLHVEAGKKLSDAVKAADDLRDRLAADFPSDDNQTTIRNYLESQKRILETRGAAMQAVRDSGISLAALNKVIQGSPIDVTLRGRRRPNPRAV